MKLKNLFIAISVFAISLLSYSAFSQTADGETVHVNANMYGAGNYSQDQPIYDELLNFCSGATNTFAGRTFVEHVCGPDLNESDTRIFHRYWGCTAGTPPLEFKSMIPSSSGYDCVYWVPPECGGKEGVEAGVQNLGSSNLQSACDNGCGVEGIHVGVGFGTSYWSYRYTGQSCTSGPDLPPSDDVGDDGDGDDDGDADDGDDGGGNSSSSHNNSSHQNSSFSNSSVSSSNGGNGSGGGGSSSSEDTGSNSSASSDGGGDGSGSSSSGQGGDPDGDCDPETEDCENTSGDCDPETEDCGEGGGGDCDPETEECGSGSGGNCSEEEKTPPSCEGDAIQCTIQESSWLTQCEQLLWQEDLKGDDEYNDGDSLLDDPSINEKNAIQTDEHDHASAFDVDNSGFLGGGSCPQSKQIAIAGRTIEITYQPVCDLAARLKPLIIALGYFVAGVIFLRIYMGS